MTVGMTKDNEYVANVKHALVRLLKQHTADFVTRMIRLLMHHTGAYILIDPHLELDLTGIIAKEEFHDLGWFSVQIMDLDNKSLYKTHMNIDELHQFMVQLSKSRGKYKLASERKEANA